MAGLLLLPLCSVLCKPTDVVANSALWHLSGHCGGKCLCEMRNSENAFQAFVFAAPAPSPTLHANSPVAIGSTTGARRTSPTFPRRSLESPFSKIDPQEIVEQCPTFLNCSACEATPYQGQAKVLFVCIHAGSTRQSVV